MKKIIRVAMNSKICDQMNLEPASWAYTHVRPMEIELDDYSGAERWILEHIDATQVHDEGVDHNDLWCEASFSIEERDRASGKSEEYIYKFRKAYGDYYTTRKMRIPFYIHWLSTNAPTLVETLQRSLREAKNNGAVKLIDFNSGDELEI